MGTLWIAINNAVLARAMRIICWINARNARKMVHRYEANKRWRKKKEMMIKQKNWQIYKMNPHKHKHTRTALSICSFLCSIIFHYPQCIHLFGRSVGRFGTLRFDFVSRRRDDDIVCETKMQTEWIEKGISLDPFNGSNCVLPFYLDGLSDSVPELLPIWICTVPKIQSKC